MLQNWLKIALINFLLAACMGAMLRFAFVAEIPGLHFTNMLHGHSHVAMLGWVYIALFALLIRFFVSPERYHRYRLIFWLTQATVLGMCIAFPMQGYGAWSITFSSLHIIFSYCFVWLLWRDLNRNTDHRKDASIRWVKAALLFMVLSTLAIWGLAVVNANGLRGSALYYALVQFYLHFQFNGWFTFAILGIFFRLLQQLNIAYNRQKTQYFFILLTISCFLTYALAVTWSTPIPALFWSNSIGVILQLVALYFFVQVIIPLRSPVTGMLHSMPLRFLKVAFLCFCAKIIMQTMVVIPYFATISYTIRNFVMGFIHLILLGTMSHFIFSMSLHHGWLNKNSKRIKIGLGIFVAGFLISEAILFGQGALLWAGLGFIPKYYVLLFTASVFLPVGIGLVLTSHRHKRVI